MLIIFAAQNDDKNVYNTTSCIEAPYRCPHPKIKFFLYTRRTQEQGEQINVLDSESLWNSHWNPNHPVKVIIHGECLKEIKITLLSCLQQENLNIVSFH